MSGDARTFPVEPDSVRAARRFVRDSLSEVATDHHAAEVLVSELTTNAVEHAAATFSVCVEIRTATVRIEVVNHAPELIAVMTDEPSEAGGYGLRLVDALANQWGTESRDTQKAVWFELARN